MKRIILCLSFFAVFESQAQQINPVPDYVFSNKMSVGRNAVTDTAAYFSIGPRYNAIRGMMPPMVTDTANMSATKRNGLLIFSIQKNKYLYWDSVGSKWAEMAGTAGSAITGSGVAGYMPEFTTSTNLDTTRLYHSAGRFAIGSTTTTNGVFNVYSGQSYMDSTLKIGNGELIVGSTSSASRKLYVTSNSDVARFEQTASDKNMVIELLHTNPNASGTIREEGINFLAPNISTRGRITFYPSDTFNVRNYLAFFTPSGSGTNAERMRIANDGEIYVNGTSDAGDFKMQVYGNQYIQGILGLGTTSPATELHILASTGYAEIRAAGASGSGGSIEFYDATTQLGDIYVDPSKNMVFRNQNEAMRLNSSRELLIGTTTDAGAYALQVAGAIYNTTGGVLAASSGEVLVGSQTDFGDYRLQVNGNLIVRGSAGAGQGISVSHNTGSISIENSMESDGDGYIYLRNGSGTEKVLIYSNGNSYFDGGNVGIGTTSPTQKLHVNGNILTSAPSGGTAKPFKIGEAATVSPTSPNRTIRVEIDGTVYYIHAKTTND